MQLAAIFFRPYSFASHAFACFAEIISIMKIPLPIRSFVVGEEQTCYCSVYVCIVTHKLMLVKKI